MLLDLKKTMIYGPVNSRRLGRSLGINILPSEVKVCPFNCVYCQYGWTKIHTSQIIQDSELPSVQAIKDALEVALKTLSIPPAYITFSGNGEPTAHPDFGQITEEVTAIRHRLAPEAKTAVLSNSALVSHDSVLEALLKLDLRIMKLDCGHPKTFEKYNQPAKSIDLEAITAGLIELSRLRDVIIQTLVSSGQGGNLMEKNITEWIERLKRIKPLSVQLYTLDRPYPASDLKPASEQELNQLKDQAQKEGIAIEVF